MRKFLFSRSMILLLLVLAASAQQAVSQDKPFSIDESPLPTPTSPVMDYAGVLDETTRQRIADKIKEFQKSSNPSVEMAVAIVKTTGGRDIFEYSLAVARGWGIGSRQNDNPGLLLLVAIDDRKYFTQVSSDLGDELPDGLVGSLQRQYLVPEFRKGDYGKGIEDTIDAYIDVIKKVQSGVALPTTQPERVYQKDFFDRFLDMIPNWLCRGLCCLAIILFFIAIASSNNKKGGRGGGGGGSGGDLLAAFLAGLLTSSGSSSWSSGSSSGWGGSSDWGGGSDWGGFGGGGDFGGGGAGGGW